MGNNPWSVGDSKDREDGFMEQLKRRLSDAASEMAHIDPVDTEDPSYLPNQQYAAQGARNIFNAWSALAPPPVKIGKVGGQDILWSPMVGGVGEEGTLAEFLESQRKARLLPGEGGIYDKVRAHGYRPSEYSIFSQWDGTKTVPRQGFKIHVSAFPEQAHDVADTVLPIIRSRGITHKIVGDLDNYEQMSGTQRGKFITAYPPNDRELVSLAKEIDDAMVANKLIGMPIQAEKQVGDSGAVHVRYASNRGGIKTPDGRYVPDVRGGPWKPEWANDPFENPRGVIGDTVDAMENAVKGSAAHIRNFAEDYGREIGIGTAIGAGGAGGAWYLMNKDNQ